MKINFDATPKTIKGEQFRGAPQYQDMLAALEEVTNRDPDAPIKNVFKAVQKEMNKLEGKVQILADVCTAALLGGEKAAKGTGDEKRALYRIAADIAHGGVVELAHSDRKVLVAELEIFCVAASLAACEALLVAVPTKKASKKKKAKKKATKKR